jgi:hypothetical protein
MNIGTGIAMIGVDCGSGYPNEAPCLSGLDDMREFYSDNEKEWSELWCRYNG